MKRFCIFLVLIQLAPTSSPKGDSRCCNGFAELCKRRYNEVAYPATHNGHSYKESDVHNQDLSLKEQFERGIRATKLHVWYDKDKEGRVVPFVCHGIDKALLYNLPIDKALDQVPFIFRPFARTCVEKALPIKELILDAFHYAYGTDNAQGALPFKHCILDPARQTLENALTTVHDFLSKHPHDVMTLILEDHTRNLEAITADFKKAGLLRYAHKQDKHKPWPTLQEMIDTDKRLVVFMHADVDLAYKKHRWMHYIWDYAWDTQWDFKDLNALKNCDYDTLPFRGKQAFDRRNKEPRNTVFIVHHFITDLVGGSKHNAQKANRKSVLRCRLQRLQEEAQHIPNIVQVDFFEYPTHDFLNVINELNGVDH